MTQLIYPEISDKSIFINLTWEKLDLLRKKICSKTANDAESQSFTIANLFGLKRCVARIHVKKHKKIQQKKS